MSQYIFSLWKCIFSLVRFSLFPPLLRAKMEMMLLRRHSYIAAHMPLAISSKDLKIKVLRWALLKPWYFERTFAWNKLQLNCGYNEVVTRDYCRSYRSFGGTPIDRMKHGAPWIIKWLFTTEDRDRVGPGAVARKSKRRCNIASCLVENDSAAKFDTKLLRHMGISFPHSDMSGILLQVVARREIRYQVVCRDRDDVSWQFRDRRRPSLSFYAYHECVKFPKEKKYLLKRARSISLVKSTGVQVASVNSRFISSSSA